MNTTPAKNRFYVAADGREWTRDANDMWVPLLRAAKSLSGRFYVAADGREWTRDANDMWVPLLRAAKS